MIAHAPFTSRRIGTRVRSHIDHTTRAGGFRGERRARTALWRAVLPALMVLIPTLLAAQTFEGHVHDASGAPLGYANIRIDGSTRGAAADAQGRFRVTARSGGTHTLVASLVGYMSARVTASVADGGTTHVDITLEEDRIGMSEVVVSASRRETVYAESPVTIDVLDEKIFDASRATNLVEGLAYQPGMRVEYQCQNCGVPQVRLNGLEGAYTQILVDSRPMFTTLNSVYGLEQLPLGIVDRIEVVRGGGSALFGANAVAGTINIITKRPQEKGLKFSGTNTMVGGRSPQRSMQLSGTLVGPHMDLGTLLFVGVQDRTAYDADGDGFTEIPMAKGTTIGTRSFYAPDDVNMLSLDMNYTYERRRGGDRLDLAPHEAMIAEYTQHDVVSAGLSWDRTLGSKANRLSLYTSFQNTGRDSYYGAGRDPNAYGRTEDLLLLGGVQFTRMFERFLGGDAILTLGAEGVYDALRDDAPAYGRALRQTVRSLGVYAQHDVKFSRMLSMLVGARVDAHSLMQTPYVSPRANVLFRPIEQLALRASVSRGFRPPAAFDEDLHITQVGGAAMLIQLDPGLEPEQSASTSLSAEYGTSIGRTRVTASVDVFHTRLSHTFVLEEVPHETLLLLERTNGSGGAVSGIGFEVRIERSEFLAVNAGATLQRSALDEAFEWSEGHVTTHMLRTPDLYGFVTLTTYPLNAVELSLTGVYTGRMFAPHYAGAISEDRLEHTPSFFDASIRAAWTFWSEANLALTAGVYNMFNSYQRDFDRGPLRDAGYIYGPLRPRSFFFGIDAAL